MKEIWKDIKNFENMYQVSNLGRVKSLDRQIQTSNSLRTYKGRLLKLRADKEGYLLVSINKNGQKTKKVHRLVCEAFLDTWDEKLEVNHLDGIRNNNNVTNLTMCTAQENTDHAVLYGNKGRAVEATNLITKEITNFPSIAEAGRELNIVPSLISRVVRGVRKTTNGYSFTKISK